MIDAGVGTVAEVGDKLLNTPEWKFAINGEYSFSVGGTAALLRLDYQYFGNSWSTFNQGTSANLPEPEPFLPRSSFQLVNARLNFFFDNVTVTLYSDNLFNEAANLSDARSIGAEFPGRPRFVTNHPRTLGVRARVNF